MALLARNGQMTAEAEEDDLLYLLSNHLILYQLAPYLRITDLLNLAATSHSFHDLLHQTPQVFRHLDLTSIKAAQFDIAPIDTGGQTWRNVQLDENLSEADFYSGPLRGIFSHLRRADVLSQVQTLILDGLPVTAEIVYDILTDPSFNVRIISLRGVQCLNHGILRGALRTACRRSRPKGMPHLQGLYIFGSREHHTRQPRFSDYDSDIYPTGDLLCQTNDWCSQRGKMLHPIDPEWASTMLDCRGVIALDAVLCKGPRHFNSPAFGALPAMTAGTTTNHEPAAAMYSLDGCAGCGTAPEGWTTWGDQIPDDEGGELGAFPLIWPPPLHSSSTRAAICPAGQPLRPARFESGQRDGVSLKQPARFIARCWQCVADWCCFMCHKWWCESCRPDQKVRDCCRQCSDKLAVCLGADLMKQFQACVYAPPPAA